MAEEKPTNIRMEDIDQNHLDHHKSRPELHHDHVAAEALGGHHVNYWSPNFIGTVVVSILMQFSPSNMSVNILKASCLAQISGYLGWVLPANTLSLINAAIGPSPDIIWVCSEHNWRNALSVLT